jgi:hypothetical protein
MKLWAASLAVCLTVFGPDSCDRSPPQKINISDGLVPKKTMCSEPNRFERTEVYPIGMRADIALDRCTGKLCKTWSWQAKTDNSPWKTYEDLPECSSLPNYR